MTLLKMQAPQRASGLMNSKACDLYLTLTCVTTRIIASAFINASRPIESIVFQLRWDQQQGLMSSSQDENPQDRACLFGPWMQHMSA